MALSSTRRFHHAFGRDSRESLVPESDGRADDERGRERTFEDRVIAEGAVVVETESVVAPENDEGVVGQAEGVEFGEQLADLGVNVGNAGKVGVAEFRAVATGGVLVDLAGAAGGGGIGAGGCVRRTGSRQGGRGCRDPSRPWAR